MILHIAQQQCSIHKRLPCVTFRDKLHGIYCEYHAENLLHHNKTWLTPMGLPDSYLNGQICATYCNPISYPLKVTDMTSIAISYLTP